MNTPKAVSLLCSGYIGLMLGISGHNLASWEFWAIGLPVFVVNGALAGMASGAKP
jgi:hypothetical protein